jgi:hypothetical protein
VTVNRRPPARFSTVIEPPVFLLSLSFPSPLPPVLWSALRRHARPGVVDADTPLPWIETDTTCHRPAAIASIVEHEVGEHLL